MNRTSSFREVWHPQTLQDRSAILQELQEILASPHFCNSKRYPALLRYIVEHTLEGKSDQLKERTLGVEVFDRPAGYDTNTDTVVRYTAGEVRKRLSLYYHELDREPPIQISLPPGSYVPEFLHSQDELLLEAEESADHAPGFAALRADAVYLPHHSAGEPAPPLPLRAEFPVAVLPGVAAENVARGTKTARRWWRGIGLAAAVLLLAGSAWRYRASPARGPQEDFWAPLLQHQHTILVCSGGSVFKEGNFSGVETAGKDIPYPFVSSQTASAIALVSALVDRHGETMDLQFSASTPLTVLREQPVILLGGYNNQWTMRLLNPLPFHFTPEPDSSIVDQAHPEARWTRDQSQPYASADDYALIARFRDGTTDSWIVVLAGLGRNGTEAATQFVTSPHYMQLLRDRLGADFASRNVEAVLKINVIEGKTGAPSLIAARAW